MLFQLDHDRTLAAIMFFAAKKLPGLTKWKICKLLFLADKEHLVRYGRPITGDTYFALEWGPVPSDTLNALNDEHPLAVEISERLKTTDSRKYPRYLLKPGAKIDFDALSKSDVGVLEHVAHKFGRYDFNTLSDIVHKDRAYLKAWNRREGNRQLMHFEDFFDTRTSVLEEVIENAEIRQALSSGD